MILRMMLAAGRGKTDYATDPALIEAIQEGREFSWL